MSYSCLNTSLLPRLGLFLDILFLLVQLASKTIFLIFLYDSSLLVYRNLLHFYTSILYPASLLNSLSSNHFLMLSLGLSIFSIMSSVKSDRLHSFQFGFISFYCVIAVASINTSNIVLSVGLPRWNYR